MRIVCLLIVYAADSLALENVVAKTMHFEQKV